jgi:hypothetical protein
VTGPTPLLECGSSASAIATEAELPHSKTRLSGATKGGLALLGYLALTLALTYPLVKEFASAIPGDSFDGWQNYWNLWWVRTALLDQHASPWFTNLLYAPTGVGLLFHTLNAFNGFMFLPVQLAWGLLPAYNTVVLFSFAVGGLGAYLLARQVLGPGSHRGAAFVAGLVFTFSPYHIAHLLGHMQLISLEWIPFFALYLLRAVDRPARTRNALMALLLLVLVTLCDWYYLLYCLIFSAVVAAWIVGRVVVRAIRAQQATSATNWRETLIRSLLALTVVWALWAVLLSPLLLPMVREARQYTFMVPDPAQSRTLSADVLAYILPQEFHPLWAQWAQEQARVFTATVSEHQVFAGFTVIGLALIALTCMALRKCHARDKGSFDSGFWLLVLIVFFVLSLGPVLHIAGRTALLPGGGEIPLPYGWLSQYVPFMDITRSVSRYDTMVMLALGVLAAAGVDFLARRLRLKIAAPIIASALVLFEFLPAPYPVSPPDTPGWYDTLAADPRPGAVLNLPANWDRPGYLLYQTVHGKPLTMAYISREDPRTLADRAPVLQHFRHLGPDIIRFDLAAQGQQVLSDLGIRWVVLDRYKMPGGNERAYTEAAAKEIFGGQPAAYEDDRLTVYEVAEPAENGPYILLGEGWQPFDKESGTRAFSSAADVTVQARSAGPTTLRITLADGSPPLNLPRDGDSYVMSLALQPGANKVRVSASQPDDRVTVSRLALETQ